MSPTADTVDMTRRKHQPDRRRVSGTPVSRPAPVGGWNARDARANMPVGDAIELDNWFPETSRVTMRAGTTESTRGTSEAGVQQSLMTYDAAGTRKLLSASNGEVWQVAVDPPVQLETGLSNDKWSYVNFNGRMVMVNGAEERVYSGGAVLSANSITGPTAPVAIMSHHSRLYCFDDNSLSFWYGGVDSISGTFTEFDLKHIGATGGKLICFGSLTRDGGSEGLSDLVCFITSGGEVFIYQGSNPGDSATWLLLGIYKIGEPLSIKGIAKMGADLVIMTRSGFIPLSSVIATADISDAGALSHKIRDAVRDAVETNASNYGWEIVFHPTENMAIFNIPLSSTPTAEQYVMNTLTGAWCKFTGLNAHTFAVYENELYMGGGVAGPVWGEFCWDEEHWTSTRLYKVLDGAADLGVAITAECKTAYDYWDTRQLKEATAVQLTFTTTAALAPLVSVAADFDDDYPDSSITFTDGAGGLWDTFLWGSTVWADEQTVNTGWGTLSGSGQAFSTRVRVTAGSDTPSWYSTNYIWKPGAIV
jgi:hypothetical protein